MTNNPPNLGNGGGLTLMHIGVIFHIESRIGLSNGTKDGDLE